MRPPSERLMDPSLKCGAKLKQADRPNRKSEDKTCQNKAGEGTSHPGYGNCKFHGGSTQAGVKAAARVYGRDLIQRQKIYIDKFGGDHSLLDVTPEEALLEEVRRSVAMVRWLEERIGGWQFDASTPHPDDPNSSNGLNLNGLPQLIDETSRGAATFTDEREWLLLYREERKHAAQVSKMAIDAGLAERMVRIAENQGQILASVIRRVLDALELSADQQALVPQVVPHIIRQITVGQPVTQEQSA